MLRLVISTSLVLAIISILSWHFASADEPRAHATKGPHKGNLIELGDEEYHAEIVHDDGIGRVTIYLLGSDAKSVVVTDVKELTISAKVMGAAVQMKLKAAPQKGDAVGASSRFVSTSEVLMELLDNPAMQPILRVSIAGKTFQGKIDHEHEDERTQEKPSVSRKM